MTPFAGYVGHDVGAFLTKELKRIVSSDKQCVILLDEVNTQSVFNNIDRSFFNLPLRGYENDLCTMQGCGSDGF